MRNLCELDWRRGQSGESGLNLLNGIWTNIHQRFRDGDEISRTLSGHMVFRLRA